MEEKKRASKKVFNKKVKVVLIILISIWIIFLLIDKYTSKRDLDKQLDVSNILDEIQIEESSLLKTEKMRKLEELKKVNSEIVGWIEISNTNINYPVLQGNDNEYYLSHNYLHEEITGGSIFLDKDYNFAKPSENLLVYGHRNTDGIMFEDLTKYLNEEFYQENKIINFTTLEEEANYEIVSVFKSRVYYKSEQDVFRYYYFVNSENAEEFDEFVQNSKDVSIYDTGITPKYGEQLLTLSTCEYSVDNGRLVIVARKK